MTPPDSLVFDLDGTLWDASGPTAVCWNRILREEGVAFREVTVKDVRSVTGQPHDMAIRGVFGELPERQIQMLIDRTEVEDGETIAELGADLYPGVSEGIKSLSSHFKLFIVSNCQKGYIETFFRHSGLESYFSDIECFGNTGRSKAENLASVIARNRLESTVMIGDTRGDEAAARACTVPFWFVSYGFGEADAPNCEFGCFPDLVRATKG